MVLFYTFEDLDSTVVARSIYKHAPHFTTNQGLLINRSVRDELRTFLSQFLLASGRKPDADDVFLRLDAYIGDGSLHILEINAHFVDGWGTALNLSRAVGNTELPAHVTFPKLWTSPSADYEPELKLACDELKLRGHDVRPIEHTKARPATEPVYCYGRWATQQFVYPYDGKVLDDKRNLARFAQTWSGSNVRIPTMYTNDTTPWEQLPVPIVLKAAEKTGEVAERLRLERGIQFRTVAKKSPFWKKCYNAGTVIGQDYVSPFLHEGRATQAVILAAGAEPVTGYLQLASPSTRNITDDSTHGPLIFA